MDLLLVPGENPTSTICFKSVPVHTVHTDTYSARQLIVYLVIIIIITTSTSTVSAIRCANIHWVSARWPTITITKLSTCDGDLVTRAQCSVTITLAVATYNVQDLVGSDWLLWNTMDLTEWLSILLPAVLQWIEVRRRRLSSRHPYCRLVMCLQAMGMECCCCWW